ncbi:hypothetical protein GCM10010991_37660 [Gemmobacter aquaticus]|uniref:Rhamnosyl transferase n=1 Tax=Gemmobacter aquaticus TaxID=490185 RepID=A0A918DEN6_9RHOB|nr:glycosyltransferase [Gemmobacter aquaticus]GGO39191.1 hypothetical protein GCM10010991_37660 [Gemmobacter aquaticus]
MTFRNQIIGLMRFSYPSKGGFSPGEQEVAQAEARLYDPARLQRRFNLFEQLTLPSLLAQADGDFRMGFLIGRGLPKPWRTRLQDAVAPLRGAKVIALDQLPHYFATRKAFAQLVSDDATHVTGFRLDDDDAIDIQHIARMRRMVEHLLPLSGLDRPLVTGCNRGFFLELKPEGNLVYEVAEKQPIGLGLAMTTTREMPENIYRRNHRASAQFYNTYTDLGVPAFIRTVHGDNDSTPHASGAVERADWADVAAAIEANFPFKAEDLRVLCHPLTAAASH